MSSDIGKKIARKDRGNKGRGKELRVYFSSIQAKILYLNIAWSVSIDGGAWTDAGTSKNQAYVTFGDPLTTVFHTLVHLGCKNADGADDADEVTAKIWNEFTDRIVRRVDGIQLTYYKSYRTMNITTASLLKYGDGQCGAWAKFFIDMRKVQGIDDLNEYAIFRPIYDSGFIVKNWIFSGSGSSGISSYPYFNIPPTDDPLSCVGSDSYSWRYSEVGDIQGIAGQGNLNPASLFGNHQVVIGGEYYDPSYGIKHTSLQAIDDNAIEGYFVVQTGFLVDEPHVNYDLNNDGDKIDMAVPVTVFLFRKNGPCLDIQENRRDY